eukprot:scaffold9452_cov48-Phaeocystis_antarctica.AAC.1
MSHSSPTRSRSSVHILRTRACTAGVRSRQPAMNCRHAAGGSASPSWRNMYSWTCGGPPCSFSSTAAPTRVWMSKAGSAASSPPPWPSVPSGSETRKSSLSLSSRRSTRDHMAS